MGQWILKKSSFVSYYSYCVYMIMDDVYFVTRDVEKYLRMNRMYMFLILTVIGTLL